MKIAWVPVWDYQYALSWSSTRELVSVLWIFRLFPLGEVCVNTFTAVMQHFPCSAVDIDFTLTLWHHFFFFPPPHSYSNNLSLNVVTSVIAEHYLFSLQLISVSDFDQANWHLTWFTSNGNPLPGVFPYGPIVPSHLSHSCWGQTLFINHPCHD